MEHGMVSPKAMEAGQWRAGPKCGRRLKAIEPQASRSGNGGGVQLEKADGKKKSQCPGKEILENKVEARILSMVHPVQRN